MRRFRADGKGEAPGIQYAFAHRSGTASLIVVSGGVAIAERHFMSLLLITPTLLGKRLKVPLLYATHMKDLPAFIFQMLRHLYMHLFMGRLDIFFRVRCEVLRIRRCLDAE